MELNVYQSVPGFSGFLGHILQNGGTVALDVKANRFGHIDPVQLQMLKDTAACHGAGANNLQNQNATKP